MRKLLSFIAVCFFCCNIYAQVTEAYPTSQRYLFNPYNRYSVYIDSAQHWNDIHSTVAIGYHYYVDCYSDSLKIDEY
ncbi:MAG: hypothetical protein K5918_07695, partial [Bacteroidales bacterium]|nr:hypothetical protein [Bacteroidales bacterium]